jgi:hypothetical protein
VLALGFGSFVLIPHLHLTPLARLIASTIPILSIAGAVIVSSLERSNKPPRPPMEDTDDPSLFEVDIQIVQDGLVTGRDYGVAFLDEGCLVFAGSRTSFRIGRQDLLSPDEWWHRDLKGRSHTLPKNAVPLYHPEHTLWVEFVSDKGHPLSFLEQLWEFVASAPVDQPGRQYPPLTAHPDVLDESQNAARNARITAALLAMTLVALLTYAVFSPGVWPATIFLSGLAFVGLTTSASLAIRLYGQMKRLLALGRGGSR